MKREIKFRFWTPDKRMTDEHAGWTENIGINEALNYSYEYGYQIMQYTGQKDKNRKELYEGDICKINNGNILVCKFRFSRFLIQDIVSQSIFNIPRYPENFEIIGNIYEHPHLLKTN